MFHKYFIKEIKGCSSSLLAICFFWEEMKDTSSLLVYILSKLTLFDMSLLSIEIGCNCLWIQEVKHFRGTSHAYRRRAFHSSNDHRVSVEYPFYVALSICCCIFFLGHWIPFSKYICLRCCYAANIAGENITRYLRNRFQILFSGNKTTRDQVCVPDAVLLRRSCIDLLLLFPSLFLFLSSISSSFLSVCHSIPDHHLHLSFLYLLSLFSVCGKWVCVTLSGCPLQVSGDSLYYRGSPSLKEWQRVTETCRNRETRRNMKRESQGEKKGKHE